MKAIWYIEIRDEGLKGLDGRPFRVDCDSKKEAQKFARFLCTLGHIASFGKEFV